MNRSIYFNFIEEKLSYLATRIELRSGLNILDLNLHSEDFYLHFFNELFGWNLKNLNAIQKNVPAIDLIDSSKQIVMQVSATCTKQKVDAALTKDLSKYKGHSFKFISISKNAEDLRAKTFQNPHNLAFSPATDIYDVTSLLKHVSAMNTERMKRIYEFVRKELKSEPDPAKTALNLTTIIKILAQEDWIPQLSVKAIPYDIEAKISHNQLDLAKDVVEEYKVHYHRIQKIYAEFDKQGANKSLSTLGSIHTEYVHLTISDSTSPDNIFFSVIDKLIRKIQMSSNYVPMIEEELELSVRILVVHAFIECKIFKNPFSNPNAHS